MISGGVLSSWPSQNGHRGVPADGTSALAVMGRLARSVAMMTQRPTMGSLRSSGIGRLRRWCSAKVLEDVSIVRVQLSVFSCPCSVVRVQLYVVPSLLQLTTDH